MEVFKFAIVTIIPEVLKILLETIVKSCVAADAVVKPVHVVTKTRLFNVTETVADAVDAVSGVTETRPGVVAPVAKDIPPVPDWITVEEEEAKAPIVTEPVVSPPPNVRDPVVTLPPIVITPPATALSANVVPEAIVTFPADVEPIPITWAAPVPVPIFIAAAKVPFPPATKLKVGATVV